MTTFSKGLEAGRIGIPVADGTVPAYRALPDTGGPFPVVLVVQEIFGVNEHIQEVCRRLARLGYFAVAPELYARQGDISQISDIREIISRVVSKVPDAQVMGDLDAAARWAVDTGKGDRARLGITGFCWGGRIVWLYAAHNPELKAGVAWYGRLTGDRDKLHPRHPLDLAPELRAPVLGLYGAKDESIPVSTVEQMRECLARAGQAGELVLYADAGHAFFADYRPSYHEPSARDGWRRLREWFRTHTVV